MTEIALPSISHQPIAWLRLYSKFVVVSVIALIGLGSLVTSHGAGLSVPDWPTSYGQNMFLFPPSLWIGGIFYEHVHRLLASGVGALTCILAAWLWWVEPRRWLKVLGFVAVGVVICQGILGGLTVLYKLPAAVSSGHAVLAQTFLIITIIVAYAQSRELAERTDVGQPALVKPALILCAMVFVQLILGAVMRHTESGLAIPDFPTTGGMLIPTFSDQMLASINETLSANNLASVTIDQVIIHFLHRIGAILVAIFAVWTATLALLCNDRKISSSGGIILLALLLQITLGVLTVLVLKDPLVASSHVVIGAVLILSCVLLVLRALPSRIFGGSL